MISTLPLNEQSIRATAGDTSYYYGFNITLTQADVPYQIVANSRPKSEYHFVVCADTVTIAETLVNPGMDIRISARQVIFQRGAVLETSGPDPTPHNYSSGVSAEQTDFSPAAKGVSGGPGSTGSPAGNIVVFGESILGAGGAAPGALAIHTDPDPAITATLAIGVTQAAIASLSPLSLPDMSWPFNVGVSGALKLTGLKIEGLDNPSILSSTIDMAGRRLMAVVSLSNLKLSGTTEVDVNLGGKQGAITAPMGVANFSVQFSYSYAIDVSAGALEFQKGSESALHFLNFSPVFNLPDSIFSEALDAFISTLSGPIQNAAETGLRNAVDTKVSAAGSVSYSTPSDAVLIARGGIGGRGQDGHAGIQGPQGPAGTDGGWVQENEPLGGYSGPVPAESIGRSGGHGGQGGDAGTSGAGGTGGTIRIGCVVTTPAVLTFDYSAGYGGPAASPGARGPGGEAGAPGTYQIRPLNMYGQPTTATSYSQGPGPEGPPATFLGTAGSPGPAGTAMVNDTPVSSPATQSTPYSEMAPAFPVEQLLISQHAATFEFLNAVTEDDYQQVLTLLVWMQNITAPFLSDGFLPAGWQQPDILAAQTIHGFATTLVSNYRAGLDFFGNPRNWVPVLTLTDYQGYLQDMIASAEIVETQFKNYVDEEQTEAQRLQAVNASAASIADVLKSLQAQIEGIQGNASNPGQLSQLDGTIASLTDQLQQQINVIQLDQQVFTAEFRKAVESTGCSFMQVINGLQSVIELGTSISDGVGAITGALAAVKDADNVIDGFKNCITVIEKVDSTVDAIQGGLNTISQLTQGQDPSTAIGLLATQQDQFDQLIGQYTGQFPSAVVLKQAVDDYFALINNRNQAIVNYNGLYLSMLGLQNQIDQYTAQQEKLASLQAQDQPDPSLPGYVSFMQTVYGSLKTGIVRQLYGENRAYFFWSLDDLPFSTNDLTVASLAATHADLVLKLSTQKEQQQAAQPFTQQISIKAADFPLAFAVLKDSKKLTFSIPSTHPAFTDFYQVIVTSFSLAFPDIQNKADRIFVNVTHAGTSQMVRASDDVALTFTHLPRVAAYTIDYGNPVNTSGGVVGSTDQGYVGVSPFAVWTLDFDYSGNAWLALDTIQSAEVTFTGYYTGPAPKDVQPPLPTKSPR